MVRRIGHSVTSYSDYTFSVRAHGGVRFYTTGIMNSGVELFNGSSAWSPMCDRDAKENFAPVDGRDVLARLAQVPLSTWNWKSQDPAIRHMGPMAQDLHAAFGLGESDKRISTVDADGVALAAIQGLHQLLQEKDVEIEALRPTRCPGSHSGQAGRGREAPGRLSRTTARALRLLLRSHFSPNSRRWRKNSRNNSAAGSASTPATVST